MEERDLKILQHVGLYRISLRPVLQRLFFGDANPGAVLQRLREEGWLRTGKLPRNVSYYQLTGKAAGYLDLPLSRATPFGAQALLGHLATLWFCCMQQTPRYRVDEDKLDRLFPQGAPSGDHCVEGGAPKSRVYRVCVPNAEARIRNIVRQARTIYRRAIAVPGLGRWVADHRYAFAILVEMQERKSALKDALQAAYEGARPLTAHAYFRIEVVPGFRTISRAFEGGGEQ